MSSANRTIVGIISSVGGGAIPPVIALAEGLRARHHQVVFVCDGGSSAQVSDRGFQTITIPDGHQMSAFFGPTKFGEWNGMLQEGETIDYVANPFSTFGEAAAREVIEYVSSVSPRFIFSDLFTLGLADELSSALDVPWCYVNRFCQNSGHELISDRIEQGLEATVKQPTPPAESSIYR